MYWSIRLFFLINRKIYYKEPKFKIPKTQTHLCSLEPGRNTSPFNFFAFTFGSYLGICSPKVHIFFFFSMWLCQDWRKLCVPITVKCNLLGCTGQTKTPPHFVLWGDNKVSLSCWICYQYRTTGYWVWAAVWRFLSNRWLWTCYCWYFRAAHSMKMPTFQGCILIPLGLIIKTKLWYVLSILHFRKD